MTYLPGIDREISIVETPIERFRRNGFITRVVIRREIFVSERLTGINTLPGVEHEHLFEEVEGERIGASEFLGERNSFPLW